MPSIHTVPSIKITAGPIDRLKKLREQAKERLKEEVTKRLPAPTPTHKLYTDWIPNELRDIDAWDKPEHEYVNFVEVEAEQVGPDGVSLGAYAVANGKSGDVRRFPLPSNPDDPRAVFVPNGYIGLVRGQGQNTIIVDFATTPGGPKDLYHMRRTDLVNRNPPELRKRPLEKDADNSVDNETESGLGSRHEHEIQEGRTTVSGRDLAGRRVYDGIRAWDTPSVAGGLACERTRDDKGSPGVRVRASRRSNRGHDRFQRSAANDTKRVVITRRLKELGFVNLGGANHDKFKHPDGRWTEVARHATIKSFFAGLIAKQIGMTWDEFYNPKAQIRKPSTSPAQNHDILTVTGEEFIVNPIEGFTLGHDGYDVAARTSAGTIALSDRFFELAPEARAAALARAREIKTASNMKSIKIRAARAPWVTALKKRLEALKPLDPQGTYLPRAETALLAGDATTVTKLADEAKQAGDSLIATALLSIVEHVNAGDFIVFPEPNEETVEDYERAVLPIGTSNDLFGLVRSGMHSDVTHAGKQYRIRMWEGGASDCDTCDGDGTVIADVECSTCDGYGSVYCTTCGGDRHTTSDCTDCVDGTYTDPENLQEYDCGICDGNGNVKTNCDDCAGKGKLQCVDCDGEGEVESEEPTECEDCDGTGQDGEPPEGRIIAFDGAERVLGIEWRTQANAKGAPMRYVWGGTSDEGRGKNDSRLMLALGREIASLYRAHVSPRLIVCGPFTPAGYAFSKMFADEMLSSPDAITRHAKKSIKVMARKVAMAGLPNLKGLDEDIADFIATEVAGLIPSNLLTLPREEQLDILVAVIRDTGIRLVRLHEVEDQQILTESSADALFKKTLIQFMPQLPERDRRYAAVFVDVAGKPFIMVSLRDVVRGAEKLGVSFFAHLRTTLAHELVHAADWAYKTAAGQKWGKDAPQTDNELESDTELLAYADTLANHLLGITHGLARHMDGAELRPLIDESGVLEKVAPSRKPEFIQRVIQRLRGREASVKVTAMPMPTALPRGWHLDVKSGDGSAQFILLDQNGTDVGTLKLDYASDGLWMVSGAYISDRSSGYGAYLYEQAMKWVTSRGEWMMPDVSVSSDAARVWEKYFQRPDVERALAERDKYPHGPAQRTPPNAFAEDVLRPEEAMKYKYRLKTA